MRQINEIIIHCTANRPDSKITIQDIRRDHLRRGFSDIGYHYVVFYDGRVEQGRPLNRPGAHCRGHNAHSIGIAYVGGIKQDGVPSDTRSDAQKKAIQDLCRTLLKQYPSIALITGHNLYNRAKACPCFDAVVEYSSLIINR